MKPKNPLCPCGSRATYIECCARWHEGALPPTAETLMRSRYSAYVLRLQPYLLATWHSTTRPQSLDLEAEPAPKWLKLEIKRHSVTGPNTAIVEFIAYYRLNGQKHQLHEVSRFVCDKDQWYYVDGEFPSK